MAESKKRMFLVTDRKSIDRGHVTVSPIPIAVRGQMEYIGDCKLELNGGNVVEFIDNGSKEAMATMKSLTRMDGILEITEKLVGEIFEAAQKLGFAE